MRRILHGRAGTGLAFVLGLLIATAGTATAAKLVTGKQIKDGSISTRDLTPELRAKLGKPGQEGPKGDSGAPGVRGEPGAKGDAGAPAVRLWVKVKADGTVLASSGGVTAVRGGLGAYVVYFPRDVSKCAWFPSVNETVDMLAIPSQGSFYPGDQMAIFLHSTNPADAPDNKDANFDLLVAC